MSKTKKPTWEASIKKALYQLGGEAHLSKLYPEVEKIRTEAGCPLSKTWKATVRRVVQDSESIASVEKGSGIWYFKDC